jgi:hypothetical protein
VLAFVTGGWAFYVIARLLAPSADEPLLCFIVGGLFSVFLYRLWITTVSSVAGTLVLAYSSLWLFGTLGQTNTIAATGNNAPLWNWGLGAFAVFGILLQFVLNQRYQKFKKNQDEKKKKKEEEKKIEEEIKRRPPPPPPAKKSWWPFGGKGKAA